jgi:Cu+-exporting ATPase
VTVVAANGAEFDVHVDELRAGDRIALRCGETVPVAATVASGRATLVNGTVFGSDPIEDRFQGDAVRPARTCARVS